MQENLKVEILLCTIRNRYVAQSPDIFASYRLAHASIILFY